MSVLSTVPATTRADRIAGIDVDRLLHDIGEASANDSSTALFGLLLNAMQVVAQMQAGGVRVTTQRETALNATYHAMNDDGQDRLVGYARQLQKHFPRQHAALTLVRNDRHGGTR